MVIGFDFIQRFHIPVNSFKELSQLRGMDGYHIVMVAIMHGVQGRQADIPQAIDLETLPWQVDALALTHQHESTYEKHTITTK